MGRFGFPIPGRKKAPPPPITVTEPMTKAHKILGSVPLNIDSSNKSWDGQSVGKAERLDGAQSRSYTDSVRRQPTVGITTPTSVAEPWGDESAIIPSSFKISATGGDDAFTETSTILRSTQSSSTLKSWYDKSKMPLSVSQQTSASAMAKGLPSKAQRMLDMDNSHAVPRTKKPSKLDISNLLAGTRSPKHSHDPMLGSDYMTRSPSLLSPPLSSGRRQRMVGKHTKVLQNESVADYGDRPSTSGSNTHRGKGTHLNGLPDLYEHYEQMSFRQIMDADLELEDEPVDPPTNSLGILPTTELSAHRQQATQNTQGAQALSQQPAQRSLLTVTKPDQKPISAEDAESVSSRHTKTSRASIITQSFQDSDLQETSVLMLSSDSEDDDFEEIETKSQKLTLTRPISRIPETMALLEQGSVAGPLTPSSAEKRLSKSSKRTSFAPSVTYLGVPSTQSSSLHTPDSQTTFAATNSASASSTRGSIISSSSASSAPSWQTRSDHGKNDAYVVALLPTKNKASSCEDSDEERGDSGAELHRDTMIAQTDQPTPPLSPTSVDFYIRSAHSSVDGATGHNRFMAVTRQEEMLLSALRHKRQTMRESRMGNQQAIETPQSPPQTKHISKASDATITNLLDFDFPAPPSSSNSTPRLPPLGNENDGANQNLNAETPPSQSDDDEKATMSPILSPAPIYPRQSQMFLKSSTYQPPEAEKKLHADDAYSPPPEALNAEDLDELLYSISQASSRSSPVARRSSRRVSSSSFGKNSRHDRRLPKLAMSTNMDPVMESEDQVVAPGIPRPDSPISPSVFPMPPTMAPLNKKMARLSAVGGVRLGDSPDWWKNEDSY